MSTITPRLPNDSARNRNYLFGVLIGAVFGVLSAYMFNRTADEVGENEKQVISATTMIGIALSAITLMRQIAESNRPRKK